MAHKLMIESEVPVVPVPLATYLYGARTITFRCRRRLWPLARRALDAAVATKGSSVSPASSTPEEEK